MRIKAGVSLHGLQPQMVLAALIVDTVYRRGGYDAVITSGSDGTHDGKPVKGDTLDPHYAGKALDFRTFDVKTEELPALVNALQTCLGPEFVVLTETDHVHVQHGLVG